MERLTFENTSRVGMALARRRVTKNSNSKRRSCSRESLLDDSSSCCRYCFHRTTRITRHHRSILISITLLIGFLLFHYALQLKIRRGQDDFYNIQFHRELPIPAPEDPNSSSSSTEMANEGGTTLSSEVIVIDPPRDCSISRPEPKPMEPTIVASYPGSGAKLTWKLIRAATGVMTGNDFDHNGLVSKGQVATIKTHYPAECCSNEENFNQYKEVNQSILLLRNPMDAIPSYHNFVYEMKQKLENHSIRAPVEEWIQWRDTNFETHLSTWVNHTKFWMSHHEWEERKITTYESLVKPSNGPDELLRLSKFVMRGDELSGPEDDIACVWDYVVNTRADENTRRSSLRKNSNSAGSGLNTNRRPYTAKQLYFIQDELEALKELYPGQLGPVLNDYLRTVMIQIRADHRMNYITGAMAYTSSKGGVTGGGGRLGSSSTTTKS